MMNSTQELDGKTLKELIEKFSHAWGQKLKLQGVVPTANDHNIKTGLSIFSQNSNAIPWEEDMKKILLKMEDFAPRNAIEQFISHIVNWHEGRFVAYESRRKERAYDIEGGALNFVRDSDKDASFDLSQGRFECLRWKDKLLFKTVYDLAIYQMILWELKPKTIIEIGSGTGGSAMWMSDLTRAYGLQSKIISLDIESPSFKYSNVKFIEGDCYKIESALKGKLLDNLEHPFLVIEDAHVNVCGVLKFLDQFLMPNDYLIVEDSEEKYEAISCFLKDKKSSYLVDTRYCDFFGRNVTCSHNSIFRRS